MSALSGIDIDLSKVDPATREVLARVGFADKVVSFTPYFCLCWIDVFLLGVSFVVFEQWWSTCRKTDRRWSRYLVYWVMLMVVAFSCVYQAYMMYWFAAGFGRYSSFLESSWIKAVTLLGAAVRVPAMSFYLHRAYTLVHNRIWIVLLVALPIVYTGAAPIAQIWLLNYLPYSRVMQRVLATSSACEVVADTIITTTIAVQLYRSRTGWSSTDRLISGLLFSLAETQTPPTIMASLTLILFYVIPNTSYQILVIFSPKVTCLCILFTLLSRVRLAEQTRANGYNNQSKSIVGRSAASGESGETAVTGDSDSLGKGKGQMGMGVSTAGYTSGTGYGSSTFYGSKAQTNSSFSDTDYAHTHGKHKPKGSGSRFSVIRFSNRHNRGMGQTASYSTHGSTSQGQTQSIDLGASFEMNVREAVDAMERGERGTGESEGGKQSEELETISESLVEAGLGSKVRLVREQEASQHH